MAQGLRRDGLPPLAGLYQGRRAAERHAGGWRRCGPSRLQAALPRHSEGRRRRGRCARRDRCACPLASPGGGRLRRWGPGLRGTSAGEAHEPRAASGRRGGHRGPAVAAAAGPLLRQADPAGDAGAVAAVAERRQGAGFGAQARRVAQREVHVLQGGGERRHGDAPRVGAQACGLGMEEALRGAEGPRGEGVDSPPGLAHHRHLLLRHRVGLLLDLLLLRPGRPVARVRRNAQRLKLGRARP
mmetsp:Transcript_94480/g.294286  ORF Transcript_94480/g.294286 Transcript_94480/m.294286 type:complete len:242 (+) Transcript_94480:905-1630(+)